MSYIEDMPDGWYAVTNQRTGVGFGFHYPTEVFKFLWYWHSFGGGFGYPWWGRTYNVGLEAFTSFGNGGLAGAVDNGTAMLVQAGRDCLDLAMRDRVQRREPRGIDLPGRRGDAGLKGYAYASHGRSRDRRSKVAAL